MFHAVRHGGALDVPVSEPLGGRGEARGVVGLVVVLGQRVVELLQVPFGNKYS
jgi:hypothetical protein